MESGETADSEPSPAKANPAQPAQPSRAQYRAAPLYGWRRCASIRQRRYTGERHASRGDRHACVLHSAAPLYRERRAFIREAAPRLYRGAQAARLYKAARRGTPL